MVTAALTLGRLPIDAEGNIFGRGHEVVAVGTGDVEIFHDCVTLPVVYTAYIVSVSFPAAAPLQQH